MTTYDAIQDFLETAKIVCGSPTNMYAPSSRQKVATNVSWIVAGNQRSDLKAHEQLALIKEALQDYLKLYGLEPPPL